MRPDANPEFNSPNVFMSQAETIVKRVMSCITLDDPNIKNIIKTESELDLAMFMSKALVASIMHYSKNKNQNELTPIPTTAQDFAFREPSFEFSGANRYPETVPSTFPKPISDPAGSSRIGPPQGSRIEDPLFSRIDFPINPEPPKQDRIAALVPEPLKISAYLEELRDSGRSSQKTEINPFQNQTDFRKLLLPEPVNTDTVRDHAPDRTARSELETNPFQREGSVEFIERVERSKSPERRRRSKSSERGRRSSPQRSRHERDRLSYERITSPPAFDRRVSPDRARDSSYERRRTPPRVREERPSYGRRPSPPRITGDRRSSPPRASNVRPKYDDPPPDRRSQNEWNKTSPPRYSGPAKVDSDRILDKPFRDSDYKRTSEPRDQLRYDSRPPFDRPQNRIGEYDRGRRSVSPAKERARHDYEGHSQPPTWNDRSPQRPYAGGDLRSKLAEKRRSDDAGLDSSVKNSKFENYPTNPFY